MTTMVENETLKDWNVDLKFMRELTAIVFEKANSGNSDAQDTIKKTVNISTNHNSAVDGRDSTSGMETHSHAQVTTTNGYVSFMEGFNF